MIEDNVTNAQVFLPEISNLTDEQITGRCLGGRLKIFSPPIGAHRTTRRFVDDKKLKPLNSQNIDRSKAPSVVSTQIFKHKQYMKSLKPLVLILNTLP
ncbi:hypothetical protein AVEN_122767-1 [Araneus ventricosus]|uniref:Uncharacterized protein n=1 Tax=Araneus ventricosus TaxID=182803 RepID=A0A4Y2U6X9_ARAVE|nr:hypothetical protein AVEN_122767-1 [Araneus ventricosus]